MQPMTTVFQQSRRSIVLCALGLAFFLSAWGIEAALVVDLRFADGTTTKDYSTWNPATDRIQVWAKVIGTNTVNNEGIRMVSGALYTTVGAGGSAVNGGTGFGITDVLPSAPFTLGVPKSLDGLGNETPPSTGSRAISNTNNPLSTDNLQDWGSVSSHVLRGGSNSFRLLAGSNNNTSDTSNLMSNAVINFISGLGTGGAEDPSISGAPRVNPGSAFAGISSSAGIVVGSTLDTGNAHFINAAGNFLPSSVGAFGVEYLVGLVAFDGNGLSSAGPNRSTTVNWQRFPSSNPNNAHILVDGTNITGLNNVTLNYTVGTPVTFTQPTITPPTLTVNTPSTPVVFNVMLNGTLTGAASTGVTVATNTLASNVTGNPSVAVTGLVNVTGTSSIPAAGNYTSQVSFVGPTASPSPNGAATTGTITWTATGAVNNAPANQRTVNVTIGNAGYATSGDTSSTTFSSAPTFQSFVGAGATVSNLLTSTDHAGAVASLGNTKAGSTATILNYRNTEVGNANEVIGMQWRTRTASESNQFSSQFLLSDVVKLSGMGTGNVGEFVLVMDYNFGPTGLNVAGLNEIAIASSGELQLAWRNLSGQWVNAVAGNIGGLATFAGISPVQPNAALGTWGIDIDGNGTDGIGKVWAVLNHNSEFAVIPEPGTLVAGGFGMLGITVAGLRRRRLVM